MNKQEFIAQLQKDLSGLPQDEIEERLTFYSEIIDDRMEEGLSEEDAIFELGSMDEVVSQIVSDTPLSKLVKERVKPKRTPKVWEIVLLILGSPIWLSLLIVAFAVILAVYVVIWSVIISLWAIEATLWAGSISGAFAAVFFTLESNVVTGLAILGASLVCAGLSIFLFFGCKAATCGTLLLTKKIILGIKSLFIRKENVE